MLAADWWKSATVYQIYPKSFCDSNGDGVGDIAGIISKLDYLKKLGIDVIWTTPMYVSPMNDNGYDIADYQNIDPVFGSMDDFKRLLEQVHQRGMKLVMDMVINHTSTHHRWFQEALKGEGNQYHHYYIWKEGTADKMPNNWASKFGGPAWQYVPALGKYYLHLFDVSQADLNWENKEMREDLYAMIRSWLQMGVDGFRLDVINLISKDQSFPDDTFATAMDDGRKYYTDGPRIHEFLRELTANTFGQYPGSLTVGEMSSTTIPHCIEYTKPENKELSMVFNFHHLKVDYPEGKKWALGRMDFAALKNLFFTWQTQMQEKGGWNAVFWCNHDQPRIVSRFGNDKKYWKESAKMLATAIHMLRGTPYVYQGEELGMTNPGFQSIEEYRDVEAINAYHSLLHSGTDEKTAIAILGQKSRDNSRSPMQWDAGPYAGFTTGTPWIGIAQNYQAINAQNQLEDKDSIFYFYQKLIQLRKNYKIISHGEFVPLYQDNPQVLGYLRIWEKQKLLVANNFYEQEITIALPDELKNKQGQILIANYPDVLHQGEKLRLRAYESVVIAYL